MAETVVYIRNGVVTACLDQDPFNQGFAPWSPCLTNLQLESILRQK
jgi:hypothetical protein